MNNLDKYFENTEKETRDEIAKLFETNLTDIDILAKLNNGELIFLDDLKDNISLETIYKIIDSPRINEMLEVIEFLPDYINIDLIDEEHLKKLLHLSIDNNLQTFFIQASYSQKLFEIIINEKKFFMESNNKKVNVLEYFYKFNSDLVKNNINLIINFLNENNENINILSLIDSSFLKEIIKNSKFQEYINNLNNKNLIIEFLAVLDNAIMQKKDLELIKCFLNLYHLHKPNGMFLTLGDEECLKICLDNNILDYINHFINEKFIIENAQELYEKLDLKKFLSLYFVYHNINEILDKIKINSVSEYMKFFDNAIQRNFSNVSSGNIAFALKVITMWDKSNLESDSILKKRNYLISRIKNQYGMDIGNREKTDLLIDKILAGERKAQPYNIATSEKRIDFILKFGDINTYEDFDFQNFIPNHILEKTNSKHIKEIVSLLEKKEQERKANGFGNIEYSLYELAFKIYLTLGYQRSKDLLSDNLDKSYGNIDISALDNIFKNIDISNITFQKDGKGFIPVLNNEAINLIFGESYKVKNTPIRNYLRDYEEKEQEINKLIEETKENPNFTEEEKVKKEESIKQELSKYKSEIERLFVFYIHYFSRIFNEWDIISEEFLKVQNKSKLKTKLNIHQIEEIIKYVDTYRKMPELGIEDEPLIQSDIFDYVGRDVQFTANPEQAPRRAIELSRNMINIDAKKFPVININDGDYTLNVFHPQDRNILSVGYKTGCCFRPNGNADNLGSDGSLLQYCTATEYGGGIEIKDKDGKVVMFSPILRNGNVLMIHSIEAPYENLPIKLSSRIHKLLKKYAEETIKESQKNGDNIDFVMITDLHNLDETYVEGDVPLKYKFKVYDENYEYNKMYNNLDTNHKIMAHKEAKTIEDISYGKVDYSYSYPNLKKQYYITVSKEDLEKIKQLEILKQNIVELTNNRNKHNDYDKLEQIKEKKQDYLKIYKSILESRKGVDTFAEYKKGIQVIKNINEKLNISLIDKDISEISYGIDWYIAVTFDGKVIANALESGKKDLEINLRKLKELRRLEIPSLELESDLPIKII